MHRHATHTASSQSSVQWNLSIKDTLNKGHLSNVDTLNTGHLSNVDTLNKGHLSNEDTLNKGHLSDVASYLVPISILTFIWKGKQGLVTLGGQNH